MTDQDRKEFFLHAMSALKKKVSVASADQARELTISYVVSAILWYLFINKVGERCRLWFTIFKWINVLAP